MKNGNHHYDLVVDGEVDRVGEAPEQGTSNAGAQVLVFGRTAGYAVVRRTKLVEKLQPKPRSFVLVPAEGCLHVEVSAWLRKQPILAHRGLLVKRSKVS